MTCRTDTILAKDWVESTGNQTYSRELNQDIEKGTASLSLHTPLTYPDNVSPKNKYDNVSMNTISANIIQTINTSPNTTSTNIIQMFIDTKNNTASEKNLKNDSPENNVAQNSALQKENVQKDTKKQVSTSKDNDPIANYNYFPIYSRSFKVKSSSTKEFDRYYNGTEDYSSEKTSQNHYGIKMITPNHLTHGVEVSGADKFYANNTISFEGGKGTTTYDMGGKGVLTGSVIESSTMGRPHSVAETPDRR